MRSRMDLMPTCATIGATATLGGDGVVPAAAGTAAGGEGEATAMFSKASAAADAGDSTCP